MTRTFTLDEANALLPRVTAALSRSTQLLGQARTIARRLTDAGIRPSDPGGLPNPADVADPEMALDIAQVQLLVEAAHDEALRLQAMGVLVRDLERGLIDFRSVLEGRRDVFLCWQLGEREIRFYHGLDDGFVGRQPIGEHRFFRSRQLVPPRSDEA